MKTQQSHVHHYVAQWYQRRFLLPGQTKYHYLDLRPDTVVSGTKTYQRRPLLNWGPAKCFCKDDLYTVKLGTWNTDDMETRFFGAADAQGTKAVEFFADYSADTDGAHGLSMPSPDTWTLSAFERQEA